MSRSVSRVLFFC